MEPSVDAPPPTEFTIPDGCRAVRSPITGSVWSVGVASGDRVESAQRMLVIEAMKMEVAVAAPDNGTVVEVLCTQGMPITAGQPLLILRA